MATADDRDPRVRDRIYALHADMISGGGAGLSGGSYVDGFVPLRAGSLSKGSLADRDFCRWALPVSSDGGPIHPAVPPGAHASMAHAVAARGMAEELKNSGGARRYGRGDQESGGVVSGREPFREGRYNTHF